MSSQPRILIIGTGFSGLAMGVYLKQAGIHDFLILEKASDVGGTWRENTYPGAECDVPSALYSFSFEHNADWQYKWSEQHQILKYLRHVAEKHGLYAHIRFEHEVASANWDEERQRWHVLTRQGNSLKAQFLVSAVGQLHHPAIPALPGRERFVGPAFHSAQWQHEVDLTNKRVAVIGNAASALQFIPQVAKVAKQVSVFQRSANWVLPKYDRPYRPWEQWLSDHVPALTKLYRLRLWLRGELLLYSIMRGNRLLRWWGEWTCRRYIARTIPDPVVQDKLVPRYPIGAKRVLFSDDYYAALARPNVDLLTEGIAELTETGVLMKDGRDIPADVLIYGTGFRTNPFLESIDVRGLGGRSLHDNWSNGAHAYLGMTTSGFPNLFMMYGPNTNLGHNSIVIMIEAQAHYIVQCIQGLDERKMHTLDVRAEVESRYNEILQQRLSGMAWSKIAESWYKHGNRITNNWAGSTFEYMRRCRHVEWEHFVLGVAPPSHSG